jgi:hypothetical protein
VLKTRADWIADYHHRIETSVLYGLPINSRVWNLVQRLYGVDIDSMHSKILDLIPPLQAGLISIKKRYFVTSTAFFNTKLNGEYKRTDNIKESSIGFGFE